MLFLADNQRQWQFQRRIAFAIAVAALICVLPVHGMNDEGLKTLRRQTTDLFYHGFDNYMTNAFPEDELKPLSCTPLTRDRDNPAHIEVNDVLGNYSLTLIDSLSTLAILASSPEPLRNNRNPLQDFRNGVEALVEQYGDGSNGPKGEGKRSKGFDLDSKVQIFETVIRGVGGLVSAHLFATGELPIRQTLDDSRKRANKALGLTNKLKPRELWTGRFKYDGQLLRLATDLANRLLPAFYTETGLPYPRVNLRHGVPFYSNSPLNADSERGMCGKTSSGVEITETCSAGAGSLVLEFTTLSRLTGDPIFEEMAKKAFWAVWARRSGLDLIGSGVDAESGNWIASYAGIGAGIDSFFEYALKSHILLSGDRRASSNDSENFLSVWQTAHAGIKRHLYRGASFQHPHYVQGDLFTGASKAFWIDSLSAYYPGLLTLGGELDEAVETHLLYTALWTRYAALPERWSTVTGTIDAGLNWWGGRPEFIESTWYLYRATKDPYYLHVGEMAIQDIQRRCWTECGWAGLEDVRTGELKDRMESFFLGETAKYLYLLFDTDHPLNTLDAPFIFTTEGHPLLLPRSAQHKQSNNGLPNDPSSGDLSGTINAAICPTPPAVLPFTISAVTSRSDLFHAAGLARLHQIGSTQELKLTENLMESSYNTNYYAETVARSPNNFTFYPWTLPLQYIPSNGTSSKMHLRQTFDLIFPTIVSIVPGTLFVSRIAEGVIINAVSGLKVGMLREMDHVDNLGLAEVYRIHSVGQLQLGRDEKVFITTETASVLNPVDPYFTRHRDLGLLDLVLEMPPPEKFGTAEDDGIIDLTATEFEDLELNLDNLTTLEPNGASAQGDQSFLSLIMQQLSVAFNPSLATALPALLQVAQEKLNLGSKTRGDDTQTQRPMIPASIATGPGAGVLPSVPDASFSLGKDFTSPADAGTFWSDIYFGSTNCDDDSTAEMPLSNSISREYQIIVLKRGDCSFSEKMRNIPSYPPHPKSLQFVIVVSFPRKLKDAQAGLDGTDGDNAEDTLHSLIRPYLEDEQVTPAGIQRHNPVPLVMVEGGDETWEMLRHAKAVGIRRRYWYESQGTRIANLILL